MKTISLATMAICLYQINTAQAAPAAFDIPSECKNLSLMQGQLLNTQFHNNNMGAGNYNPAELVLKTSNGLKIGKIEYLGGDSEEDSGPNAGKYPCDLDKNLCLAPGDAGGPNDWARVTVTSSDKTPYDIAKVVVSFGSRGGCIINSSSLIGQ